MARRIRRSTFVRGVRRNTDWSASLVATDMVTVAASSAQLLQTFVPASGGETVIRTRGLFAWRSDQFAASEVQIGAVGIGVVTEQANSVGITAIPHPDTDSAWGGWLWHSYFTSRVDFTSGAGFLFDGVHRMVIDSKAMRKVGDNERLIVVIENSGAFGLQVSSQIRLLSKLH